MTKLVQNDIASLTNEQSALAALNSNYASLEAFSDNVLARDGATPNQMLADLDMNSNHVLNLPAPLGAAEPLRLQDLSTFLGTGTLIVPHVPDVIAVDHGVVADGTTDNTVALNSLKALLSNGGRLILPRGVIAFSSQWDMSSLNNVIIQGQGGQDLTYSATKGTVLKYTGGAGTGTILNLVEHKGVWVRDLQIVYVSNSFVGTVVNCFTSFTTGCGSGFENVQIYQVTNSGYTAGQAFYLRGNIDVTFRNCYVSHCSFGWIGKFSGETLHTNMIKLYNCTSIGIVTAAIVNPDTGWSCYSCNFELSNTGNPSGILTNETTTNFNLYSCVFADSSTNGTWINFGANVTHFGMYGGAILTLSGTTTGILFNSGTVFNPTIIGVYFSGPTTCINFNVTTNNAVVFDNGFFTGTGVTGSANLNANSIVLANQGQTNIVGDLKSNSPTIGIGYITGAGGTVTQATNKTTAVTLNKTCGQITMNGAALNAGTSVVFTVNNSSVASTDIIVVTHDSVGGLGNYVCSVNGVTAGSFNITVQNISVANLSEAIVIGFAVIKAVTA